MSILSILKFKIKILKIQLFTDFFKIIFKISVRKLKTKFYHTDINIIFYVLYKYKFFIYKKSDFNDFFS